EVDFKFCFAIPDTAWELLGDGTWPRLRHAKGVPEEHLERLRKAPLDLEAGAGEAASSMELQEPVAKQLPMHPVFVTSVVMPGEAGAAAVQGDLGLLPALARSDIEELNLDRCRDVPAAVWQQVGQAQGEAFQKLRCFYSDSKCFDKESKGIEGAAWLLLALSRCQSNHEVLMTIVKLSSVVSSPLRVPVRVEPRLQQGKGLKHPGHSLEHSELGMSYCYKVPAAAWQLLATARWEQLRKADFSRCFDEDSKGAEGAAGLLSALARCRQLQDASTGLLRDLRTEAPPESEDSPSDPAGKELLMYGCNQISVAAWQQLEGAHWPKLTKVDFDGCFDSYSKGIEAATGLLAFLGRCPELQDRALRVCVGQRANGRAPDINSFHRVLSLGQCDQIPAAAWQQLEGAQWPKLTKVDFNWRLGFWAPVGVCVIW
ncbi:unnamed protein product, partial [Symbiodinium necroappetens]